MSHEKEKKGQIKIMILFGNFCFYKGKQKNCFCCIVALTLTKVSVLKCVFIIEAKLMSQKNSFYSYVKYYFSFAKYLLSSFCTAKSSNTRIYWIWKTFLGFKNGKNRGKKVLGLFKVFWQFLEKISCLKKEKTKVYLPKLDLLLRKS